MARVGGAVAALSLLLLTGCTSDGSEQPEFYSHGELRLVSFDSCQEALDQLRAAALEHPHVWGYGGPMPADGERSLAAPADDGTSSDAAGNAAPEAAQAPAGPEQSMQKEESLAQNGSPDQSGTPDHSGTNVHESGVDEPDIIKTDGTRIVTATHGVLRIVDADSRTQTGEIDLFPEAGADAPGRWTVSELMLSGDRALVMTESAQAWLTPSGPAQSGPARTEPDLVGPEPAEPDQAGAPDEPVEPDQPVGPGLPLPEPDHPLGPRLLLVDLAGEPEIVAEYTVDGSLVDARATGSLARVVVRSTPRVEFPQPGTAEDENELREQYEAAIAEAELSDFLPRFHQTAGDQEITGVVDCAAVSRPSEYTGTSMVTVLTFDLAAPDLGDGEPVTVVADGQTVYSSGQRLYLAHDLRWQAPPQLTPAEPGAAVEPEAAVEPAPPADSAAEPGDEPPAPPDSPDRESVPDVEEAPAPSPPEVDDRTEIHVFDTSGAGAPSYLGSGAVDGWLLNQYAMSEWDGHLRVATTTGETGWGDQSSTESTVYVLTEQGDGLAVVGSVGGLGKGERIYSVRFAGPVGYVVTFRQVDPLYTVDLSDPAAPELLGELKITGYSAYLHEVADGRLVGVGQAADEQGRTEGLQVSLFDVSDLASPDLLGTHAVASGYSDAEHDPHAFLWWAPEQLLVLPLVDHQREPGALLLRLESDEFTALDVISHPAAGGVVHPIQRSLVIDQTLWTLSQAGLAAHDLATLDLVGWLPAD